MRCSAVLSVSALTRRRCLRGRASARRDRSSSSTQVRPNAGCSPLHPFPPQSSPHARASRARRRSRARSRGACAPRRASPAASDSGDTPTWARCSRGASAMRAWACARARARAFAGVRVRMRASASACECVRACARCPRLQSWFTGGALPGAISVAGAVKSVQHRIRPLVC